MTQPQRITIHPSQRHHHHVVLTTDQQHYLRRVLRLQAGEMVIVMDGQGQQWRAALAEDLATATLQEALTVHTELPLTITLLVAPPKGNGLDEVIRQATELGVKQIVPVISDRTLLKPSPKKQDRWQRIAQEAAEQSERTYVPEISPPTSFHKALQQWIPKPQTLCYLGVARGEAPHWLTQLSGDLVEYRSSHQESPTVLDPSLSSLDQSASSLEAGSQPWDPPNLVIATGPEGGWTDAEIEQAIQVGYQPVSLGARILRAVTAPLAALAIAAAIMEADGES